MRPPRAGTGEPAEDACRRIIVVTAAMGGGHNQIAAELQRRLVATGHRVLVIDLLDMMPPPAGAGLQAIYRFLVGRAPSLYDRVYATFFVPRQGARDRVGVPVRLALPRLRRRVRAFRPDAVVSTYHLAALAVGSLRAEGALAAPAITFITQFAVHDLWLHPAADLEMTVSRTAAEEACRRSGRQAIAVGPVVRAEFERSVDADAIARLRAAISVRASERAALVTTGSFGFAGAAEQALSVLNAQGLRPVVVAGRNSALRERLERRGDAAVLGWVEDVRTLMAACDVVVDNAAGTTAKEALRLGVPVVTFRPLAGHGRDDARALAKLGLTDVVDDAAGLAAAVARLVGDPRARAARIDRGKRLFVADAAAVVAAVARNGVHAFVNGNDGIDASKFG